MRRATIIGVVMALAGCGELENEPLTMGEIRGQMNGVDITNALVAVMGLPNIKKELPASGVFELDNVPQGEIELFSIASPSLALRVPVVVRGASVTNLGTLDPRPAAFVALHLAVGAHQRLANSKLHVHGTPLTYSITDDGRARIGPLPAGCYDLVATTPGFSEVKQGVCLLEQDEFELDLAVPDPDGTAGNEGCLVAGCMDSYVCQTDGKCTQ